MSWLKKILPNSFKKFIFKVIHFPGVYVSPFFSKRNILASLYYLIFSNKFSDEHKAVLAGRFAYSKSLLNPGETSALLRRNTHRLEKGLIMQPRRDSFAEEYIIETVETYRRSVQADTLCAHEKKWFEDVLVEYFNKVIDTRNISKARDIFNKTLSKDSDNIDYKFIPYTFENLNDSDITYEELNKLFIKRRSVRWYQDKLVPLGLVEKAVKLASLAPSACNRQSYRFFVSSNKEKAIEMARCAGGTAGFSDNLPCVIAVVGDLSAYQYECDRHLIYIDGSLASMQLILALETLGLSSCSINWSDRRSADKKIRKIIELKDYERIIMLIAVGYADNKGGIPYSHKKTTSLLLKQV